MTSDWQDLTNRELHTCIDSISPWQTGTGLRALLELVRRELNADSSSWLVVFSGDYGRDTPVIDWMDSWKVMDVAHCELGHDEYWKYVDHCQMLAQKTGKLSPLTRESIQHTGTHRCHRLSQLGPADPDYQRSHGNRDRILGIHSLNDKAESYLLANNEDGLFSESDNNRLLDLVLSFPRLQHWLMLERGLAPNCERPLSPRQQQLVRLLLQPLGKAEIAAHMGLAESTVHSYTMALYRNFQITSRPELMSLWLASPLSTP